MLLVENKAREIKSAIFKKKAKVQLNLADINIGEIVIFPVLSCKPQNSNSPIAVQRVDYRSTIDCQALGALMCKNIFRFVSIVLIVTFSCSFVGCKSIPVPEEKKSYIGTWEGVGFHLTISDNGGVDYRRVKGKRSTKISGPLKNFKGDDFIVGVLFFTTTFEVHQPPYLDGDDWYMVIDGVELKKVAGPIT